MAAHGEKAIHPIERSSKRLPLFYVPECRCGWSGPLCQTVAQARIHLHHHEAPPAAAEADTGPQVTA